MELSSFYPFGANPNSFNLPRSLVRRSESAHRIGLVAVAGETRKRRVRNWRGRYLLPAKCSPGDRRVVLARGGGGFGRVDVLTRLDGRFRQRPAAPSGGPSEMCAHIGAFVPAARHCWAADIICRAARLSSARAEDGRLCRNAGGAAWRECNFSRQRHVSHRIDARRSQLCDRRPLLLAHFFPRFSIPLEDEGKAAAFG